MTKPPFDHKKSGYLLPEEPLGHDLICVSFQIPNERAYRAAVTSQIYGLAKWTSWERMADERPMQVIELLRQLIHDTLIFSEDENCVDCDAPCEPEFCRVVFGQVRILYEDHFIPYLEAIRNDAQLDVEYNYVNYLDVWGLNFVTGGSVAIFDDAGQYFYNLEQAGPGSPLDGLIAFINSTGIPATRRYFYCEMEMNLAFTQISYDALLGAIGGAFTTDEWEKIWELWVTIPLKEIQMLITEALYTTPLADCTVINCDAPDFDWCYDYDFTLEETWSLDTTYAGSGIGEWSSGFGWKSNDTTLTDDTVVIRKSWPSNSNVRRVEVRVNFSETNFLPGDDFGGNFLGIYYGVTNVEVLEQTYDEPGEHTLVWEDMGSLAIGTMRVLLSSNDFDCPCRIEYIRIEGDDPAPTDDEANDCYNGM